MQVQRRWTFGLGTVFSLIVVYFIYMYSKDKGWSFLAFMSKWYLIIIGGLTLLSFGIILLIIVFSLLLLLLAAFKLRKSAKAPKKKSKEYIDVEYKVKE